MTRQKSRIIDVMVYRGTVKNGVVVLRGKRKLADGTLVDVKPVQKNGARGSAQAILRHAGIWSGVADEVDRLLREIKAEKRQEARRQTRSEK